ncbi:c-type cytochrome [Pseudenhygromyxa sp. WMMC2535]|uniref:cbb3-type cytochrome c oxidase N-terminal domain-containing protein n=1 Tax=Pseudenhygromyxa sp. WMMC2535 TaxID=2712867 RepID=UPI0015573433|nr:cbb3-type cytochrome c oxidase N-terminal domain-containing protein [Pseudenhygromyxa sp. WMMC2535]NVB40600.1 c-type cytochrome [Pseudenhygromyxa sp. WMMC2535]
MAAPPDDLLDHDYDGIREFDNPLPKWWLYLFYGSILFAIVYIPYYHFGPGALPTSAWAEDMEAWYEAHPPPELPSDAELEAMAADPTFVSAGEATFKIRCAACHAADGGGVVGPNLTDDYTLYGYGRDQIVAVIYHGTKFGMLSWKDQLSLDEIYQVGAYVHSLRGTTPAKAKDAEGVLIGSAAAADDQPEDAVADDAVADDAAAETGDETGEETGTETGDETGTETGDETGTEGEAADVEAAPNTVQPAETGTTTGSAADAGPTAEQPS